MIPHGQGARTINAQCFTSFIKPRTNIIKFPQANPIKHPGPAVSALAAAADEARTGTCPPCAALWPR